MLSAFASACYKPQVSYAAPSICSLATSADAIVVGTVSSLGPQETVEQAGLSPIESPTETLQSSWMVIPVTISVSSTVKGASAPTVSAFASAGEMGPGFESLAGIQYPDGTLAAGYFFMRKNGPGFFIENGGLFRREQGDAGVLQNDGVYRAGLPEQSLAVQVAADAPLNVGPCPSVGADAGTGP
ncbi:MAG: hypothetical protein ACYCWW_15365 [Deltaproteobacteria bacterium]